MHVGKRKVDCDPVYLINYLPDKELGSISCSDSLFLLYFPTASDNSSLEVAEVT